MLFEELLQPDMPAYLVGWSLLTYVLFKTLKDPQKLDEILDEKQREKERCLYITNYASLLHALILVVLRKK